MQVGGLTHSYDSSPQQFNNIHSLGGGKVAACATYDKALSDEEIMDHYVTMTQAFTIRLLADSDDTRAAHGDNSGSGDEPHPEEYWVGPHGIREVTQPNTWGSGNADMFGMFHDRLWRDASQPTMEFLNKGGQAALVYSPLVSTTTLTQVETWSEASDHRVDWRVEGDMSDWEYSRGHGLMVCAVPVYFCVDDAEETKPTYPWCGAAGHNLPSWVGDDVGAQLSATATWEYKLFDSFGASLDDKATTVEGTGSLLRIGKEASGSTIHNYWLYGQTGAHGESVAYQHSGYEGDVRSITKLEDRRFSVFSTAQKAKSLYGMVNLKDTTRIDWPSGGPGNDSHGSVRSVDLSSASIPSI